MNWNISKYGCCKTRGIVAVVLLVTALMLPMTMQGQSKRQLENEKAKIEKEIARLNTELGKAKKSSKNSTKQINLLKKRIAERNKLIGNINGQMRILDVQIVKTQDSLRVVRSQIDSMKVEYAKVVRSLYDLRNNLNPTGLVLDNESYNYSYLKMKYFKEYSRYRRHQATMIERKQQVFEEMTLDLQRQKNEKNTLLAQERKQKDALAKEQKKEQKNLTASQQQEKNLQKQISKKEQQKRKLQQQIQQIINEEVAKAGSSTETKPQPKTGKESGTYSGSGSSSSKSVYKDAASMDFVANKGRMSWPVNYKSVAREYGLYTRSSGGQNRNLGIDLVCSPGTQVSAVYNGTVARVFTTPTGTKGVIVKHGGYMTVYAGLGSVNVSSGSKVTARQTIGTVAISEEGDSEFCFQVWCGKDALNPRQWLK